jgi:hypothetical protein
MISEISIDHMLCVGISHSDHILFSHGDVKIMLKKINAGFAGPQFIVHERVCATPFQ